MLSIRLSRQGHRNVARYRIVVQEHTKAPSSKNIEIIGHYDPTADPIVFKIDKKRLTHWRGLGAQVSDTVARLLGEKKKHHETDKQAAVKAQAAQKAAQAKKHAATNKAGQKADQKKATETAVPAPTKTTEAKPESKTDEKPAEEKPANAKPVDDKPANVKPAEPKENPKPDSDKTAKLTE